MAGKAIVAFARRCGMRWDGALMGSLAVWVAVGLVGIFEAVAILNWALAAGQRWCLKRRGRTVLWGHAVQKVLVGVGYFAVERMGRGRLWYVAGDPPAEEAAVWLVQEEWVLVEDVRGRRLREGSKGEVPEGRWVELGWSVLEAKGVSDGRAGV